MTDNATETALAKVVFTPSGKHGNFIVGTSRLMLLASSALISIPFVEDVDFVVVARY